MIEHIEGNGAGKAQEMARSVEEGSVAKRGLRRRWEQPAGGTAKKICLV